MFGFKRRLVDSSVGFNDAQINEHNEFAGAKKTLPLGGCLKRIGAITATHVTRKRGETIALFNNSGSVAWFIKGETDADVSATPDSTNGIAVPPNSYFYVSMGPNRAIKGSASIIAYKVMDDTLVEEYKTT